ncbi:hypothetical protein N431DRAFT_481107 [Stipitochalara longipes BDJ]|nr:hypothetical protein N431DRAFT_481107 [Stipitochalara longipes BDJ]
MDRLISTQHSKCYTSFQGLTDWLERQSFDFGEGERCGPARREVQEQLIKYRVWAGNVGAFHTGPRYRMSLDYRLREAPFYKDQILNLLDSLENTLRKAKSSTQNNRKLVETIPETDNTPTLSLEPRDEDVDSPWDISDSDEDSQLPEDRKTISSDRNIESIKPTSKIQGIAQSTRKYPLELPLLVQSIRHTVSCLYRIPIRRPAPIQRLKENATAWSLYQHFDILHVQDKFPQISADVARRLGKSISRRRQLLRYRESHSEALGASSLEETNTIVEPLLEAYTANLENKPDNSAPGPRGRNVDAKSLASSRNETVHTIATTLRIEGTSGDVLSVPYAHSIPESKSSKASTFTGKLKVEVPRRPRDVDGKEMEEFECPFCFTIQCVRNQHQWKKHVLSDLQPYVCTFEDCDCLDDPFDRQQDWFKHEVQIHRVEYHCNIMGHPQFPLIGDFLQHMEHTHQTIFDGEQQAKVMTMFQQPMSSLSGICKLCSHQSSRIQSHVARHLEQLALFAIPRKNEAAEEDSQKMNLGSNSSHSSGSSQRSSITGSETSDNVLDMANNEFSDIEAPDRDDEFELALVPDSEAVRWDFIRPKFEEDETDVKTKPRRRLARTFAYYEEFDENSRFLEEDSRFLEEEGPETERARELRAIEARLANYLEILHRDRAVEFKNDNAARIRQLDAMIKEREEAYTVAKLQSRLYSSERYLMTHPREKTRQEELVDIRSQLKEAQEAPEWKEAQEGTGLELVRERKKPKRY